jgi:hypothetical protein
MDPRGNIPFQFRRWMRPLIALAGLAISAQLVLAVRMYLTAFPTPSLKATTVLQRSELRPRENLPEANEILVGIEWSTAASFRSRMTNTFDHRWTNALEGWRWFVTWIPRVAPGQTNLDLKSRVLRMREDGMADAPLEVAPGPTHDQRTSPWNPSTVPHPTLSAEEAISKVEAYLRNQPATQEEVLIVAADWTTPDRFNRPRIIGGMNATCFLFSEPTDAVKWVWIITCVHRAPHAFLKNGPDRNGGKNDGVTLYRVESNGRVDVACAMGL